MESHDPLSHRHLRFAAAFDGISQTHLTVLQTTIFSHDRFPSGADRIIYSRILGYTGSFGDADAHRQAGELQDFGFDLVSHGVQLV